MALVTGAELAAALHLDYDPVSPDAVLDQVAEAADDIVGALLTTAAYAAEPAPCKEAALQIAEDMYQARISAGGQAVATDFSPGPFRLTTWLTKSRQALLAPYMDPAGMVG